MAVEHFINHSRNSSAWNVHEHFVHYRTWIVLEYLMQKHRRISWTCTYAYFMNISWDSLEPFGVHTPYHELFMNECPPANVYAYFMNYLMRICLVPLHVHAYIMNCSWTSVQQCLCIFDEHLIKWDSLVSFNLHAYFMNFSWRETSNTSL